MAAASLTALVVLLLARTAQSCTYATYVDINFDGTNLPNQPVSSTLSTADECAALCCATPGCKAFTLNAGLTGARMCFLKSVISQEPNPGAVSGLMDPTCDITAFPIATPDVECFGLGSQPQAKTAEECALACCAQGEVACSTWQFCPVGAACGPQASLCWTGQPLGDNPNQVCHSVLGWQGGIRGTPPLLNAYYTIVPVSTTTSLPLNSAVRHCDSLMSADPYHGVGNQDFFFRVVEAIDDDPLAVSLQPLNYFFNAISTPPPPPQSLNPFALGAARFPDVPAADLSWRVVPGLQNQNLFSLVTQSLNPLFDGQYMTLSSAVSVPCKYNNPMGDMVLAPANSVSAGNGTMVTQTFMFVPTPLVSTVVWTTDHHDSQNSGYSSWDGPGEAVGVCHEQMIKDDPLDPAANAQFFSSGVTSAVDGWWFGGDSSDTLYMLEDLLVATQGDDRWQSWTINLAELLHISAPATPYGIVGAPAVLFPDNYQTPSYDATKNMLFVASADGYVVAINPLYCFSGTATKPRAEAVSGRARAPLSNMRKRAAKAKPRPQELVSAGRGLRGDSAAADASPVDKWVIDARIEALPPSDVPNGAQWAVYSNVNVMYACPPGCSVNVTVATWPECQAACWADFAAGGALGDPTGCIAWVWHDSSAEAEWVHKCLFGKTPEAFKHVRSQNGHVSGVLTMSDPGPGCIVWARQISARNAPSYSSARVIRVNGVAVVLVSETDANLDTGGILHAYDATNGSELWTYAAMYNGSSVGFKGVVPAQIPPSRDIPGRFLVVAYGGKVALLDMMACGGGQACPEVASFDTASQPGGGDAIVSSPVVSVQGDRVFFHSATGTLWKLSLNWDFPDLPPVFLSAWACRYSRSNSSFCIPATETVRGADGLMRPVRDYGVAGGFYQPTTRAERDELHALIVVRHAERYGAARGAPASDAERADAVAHVARLANELPRSELYTLVTPSGYLRKRANGKPGPTEHVEDFGGLFPFATPALYYDGVFQTNLVVATVDFRLDVDSGLFVVNEVDGNPLPIAGSGGRTFAIFDATLQDGTQVPLGRSRSSPAFDRQRHVYVGFDTDFANNPVLNETFPVLVCADEEAKIKWAIGLGEVKLSEVGAASVVVTQGPRGDNRAYMVSTDGVSTIIEAQVGVGCPTGPNPLLTCSGFGDCDCATSVCECNGCKDGDDCSLDMPNACLINGGECQPDGTCACADACHSGPQCDVVTNCGNGGQCNPVDGSCTCPGCVELNSYGVCNVLNATSAYCNGQQCLPGGGCGCAVGSCRTGPTCAQAIDCGPHGRCSSADGSCVCDTCWSLGADAKCSVQNTCSGEGTCSPADGTCSCVSACFSGDSCERALDCNHGTCDPSFGTCTCAPGWGASSNCETCAGSFFGPSCIACAPCDPIHGSCDGGGSNSGTGACICSGGYSGADCSAAPAGNSAAGPDASAPGVAAGVSVGVIVTVAAAVYCFRSRLYGGAGSSAYRASPLSYSPVRGADGSTSSSSPGASSPSAAAARLAGAAASSPGKLVGSLIGGPAPAERVSLLQAARAQGGRTRL